jgi:hypothetical protein
LEAKSVVADSGAAAAPAPLAFLASAGFAFSFASQAIAFRGFTLLATCDTLGLVHGAPKMALYEVGGKP